MLQVHRLEPVVAAVRRQADGKQMIIFPPYPRHLKAKRDNLGIGKKQHLGIWIKLA